MDYSFLSEQTNKKYFPMNKKLSITLLTTVSWKNKNWSKRVGEKWDLGRLSRKNVTAILVWKKGEINYLDGRKIYTYIRYHSRFLSELGMKAHMYKSCENHHFV